MQEECSICVSFHFSRNNEAAESQISSMPDSTKDVMLDVNTAVTPQDDNSPSSVQRLSKASKYCRVVFKNISVEPLLFLYGLGFSISQSIAQNLYMDKICQVSPTGFCYPQRRRNITQRILHPRLEAQSLEICRNGTVMCVINWTMGTTSTFRIMCKRCGDTLC